MAQRLRLARFASQLFAPPGGSEAPLATVNVASVLAGASVSGPAPSAVTGDPVICSNAGCRAVLSRSDASRLKRDAGRTGQVWKCQFCGTSNEIDVEQGELPTSDVVEYVLTPAQAHSSTPTATVFCIDVSGSMCVTTEVPAARAGADPRWVSRLECVQQAVCSQIESTRDPNRIAIVTFGNDVTVFGDCSGDPVTLAGEKLSDWDQIVGSANLLKAVGGVGEARPRLLACLRSLQEEGQTALGPALLTSVAIAIAAGRGSKVVLCTDGIANVGLGSIESTEDGSAAEFYSRVGLLAANAGVAVSVLGIKGAKCSLENLGRVADSSGGCVELADPLQLTSGFRGALDRAVLATSAKATIVLHSSMRLLPCPDLDIGNIYVDSEATFSFEAIHDMPSEVPYQVQLMFTRMDGCRCLRVQTGFAPAAADTLSAEKNIDVMVVGVFVSKTFSRLVHEGQVGLAQDTARAFRSLLLRAVRTEEQRRQFDLFESNLQLAETTLRTSVERNHLTDGSAELLYKMKGTKAAGCSVQ